MSESESADVYDAWVDRYEAAYRDPTSLGSLPCPSCTRTALQLAFVDADPQRASATAVFWCSSCRRGLVPNRAPLQERHHRCITGADAIPDFDIVRPGRPAR